MTTQSDADIQWADAPRRVEFGCDMMQGLVGLGKDHTLTLYAEKEALHLVGPAMAAVVDAERNRLVAQRDALLAALKRAEPLLLGPILLQARAAIKAVEEGK